MYIIMVWGWEKAQTMRIFAGLLTEVTYAKEEFRLCLRLLSTVLDYFMKQSIPPTSPLGWTNGLKMWQHGMANFFVCTAILSSEVGAGTQFNLETNGFKEPSYMADWGRCCMWWIEGAVVIVGSGLWEPSSAVDWGCCILQWIKVAIMWTVWRSCLSSACCLLLFLRECHTPSTLGCLFAISQWFLWGCFRKT